MMTKKINESCKKNLIWGSQRRRGQKKGRVDVAARNHKRPETHNNDHSGLTINDNKNRVGLTLNATGLTLFDNGLAIMTSDSH